jgi:DNA-binding MarR family transcriptional regulator
MGEDGKDWLKGCTCFRLRRTARRMTQIYDAHLAPSGLTLTQYSLLANLVRRDPPTVHVLAEVMGMDRTTLTRNLKPLLTRGLLVFTPGTDRRSKCIQVTPEGQSVWAQAKTLWRLAQDEINSRLGDGDVAELHRRLDEGFERLGGE